MKSIVRSEVRVTSRGRFKAFIMEGGTDKALAMSLASYATDAEAAAIGGKIAYGNKRQEDDTISDLVRKCNYLEYKIALIKSRNVAWKFCCAIFAFLCIGQVILSM